MSTKSIVYLVHDDQQVRKRAVQIAESLGFDARVAASAEDFIDLYDDGRDSCLVTDLQLRGYSADEFLDAIENQSLSIPAIFVSAHADVRSAVQMMKRGAVTVLDIPFRDLDLRDAIDEAIHRDASERSRNLERHQICARIDSLNEKERNVMDFVVQGLANKVIAKRLGVSIRTVESRRQAVFQKMKVNSLAELVRCAIQSQQV